MIATGYPGEIADTIKERAIWGAVSTVPFAYILFVLWFELKGAIARQPERVQTETPFRIVSVFYCSDEVTS